MATEFSLGAIRFEDVRAGIITYLEENGTYNADFDYSGSTLSYQIDTASYLTMLMSYQNILKSNNIFIDTTTIRKNAISISKSMGYRPKRKISSSFTGSLEYFGDSATGNTFVQGDTIIIPSRTKFVSIPDGYIFINLIPITLYYVNEILLSGDFILTEGEFKIISTFGDGTKLQSFVINDINVEEYNLSVSIRTTNTNRINNIRWTYAPSFFSVSEENIYFLEEDISTEYRPKIIFGDGLLGQIPTNTETIELEYLRTKGIVSNGQTNVIFQNEPTISKVGSFTYDFANLGIVIPDLQVSFGGKDNETLEEIQFNSPRFYSAGGRGVTKDDLLSILTDFSSTMQYYNVIGSNVLFPGDSTKRGIGYIVGVPTFDETDFLNNEKIYLTELEENEILPQLFPKTVLGTDRIFVKPTYEYVNINPTIEVPATYSDEEIQTITNNAYTNIQSYYDTYIKGLGKNFRISKFVSSLSNTPGVISTIIELNINFIINYDSFYNSRESSVYLPILYSRDSGGYIQYDEFQNPITTNFIKKRSNIISKENESRETADEYTQFTLPIESSSIYGPLTHKNSERYLYNIDVSQIEFITFELTGLSGNQILHFNTFNFKDQNDVTYIPNLYEITSVGGYRIWKIQLNGRDIVFLYYNISSETFSLQSETTTYLEDIGFEKENTTDTEVLHLREITETDENDITTTFFTISSLLTNEIFSDVRIYSINTLGDAQFNFQTFQWEWTNLKIFKDNSVPAVDREVLPQDETSTEETVLQVHHGPTNIANILKLYQFNGTFDITNYNVGELTTYDQRNDLKLTENYTIDQESNEYEYQFSSLSTKDGDNIQTVYLNQEKEFTIQTVANTGIPGVLNDKWFHLFSAENATHYYVWFDSSGNGVDPDPDISWTGIVVELQNNDTDEEVAEKLQLKLESETDFSATFSLNIVTVTNAEIGKCNNCFDDPTIAVVDRTGFTFGVNLQGGENTVSEINNILGGDLLRIRDSGDTNNDGYFVVRTVNPSNGTLTVYNYNGILSTNYQSDIIDAAIAYKSDTTVFTDETTEANENTIDDVNLLPAADNEVDDAYYFGKSNQFNNIIIDITQAGSHSLTLVWEYWDGTAWDTITVSSNESTDFTEVGRNYISFDIPDDWTASTINSQGPFYYIRARVSVFTSIATQPLAAQIFLSDWANITHYKVSTGTYGSYSVSTYDIYHDISIGTLNYESGKLIFTQNVKGYSDSQDPDNRYTIVKNIKTIFDNYSEDTKMDVISIYPIDNLNSLGEYIGKYTDFDEIFNQFIFANISEPIVKK